MKKNADVLAPDYHDYYDGERPYEESWADYFCEKYTVDLIRAIWDQAAPFRLLDCGSACGLTLAAFAALGVDAWGVENSEYIHRKTPADWRSRNLLGDVRALPFPDDHFDFVYDTSLCYVPARDLDQAVRELFRVCRRGIFHGAFTAEMTLGGVEADEASEDIRSLYPLEKWAKILLRNGFEVATDDPERLARLWQIEIDACAAAGQVPWYPDAQTMRYCFYSKPAAPGTPFSDSRRVVMDSQPPALALDDTDDEEEVVHVRDLWAIARFLGPFLQPYRRRLLVLALVLLVDTAINFCFPIATQFLIDQGLIAESFDNVVAALVFIAAGAIAITVLGVVLDFFNAQIFSAMTMDIREELFAHVQRLSMPFFTRTQGGEVLSRSSGDIVALESTLTTMVPWCLVPLLEVIYSVVVMFYFNVWLGLIGSVIFPLTLLAPRVFAAWAFRLSYEKRLREAEVMNAVAENVSAQAVVKAFGLEKRARERFGILGLLWLAIAFRTHFFGALVERSSNSGVYIVHVIIFGLGAYWAFTKQITVGTFVAFEATFLAMGYALTYVTQYVPTLAQAAGSIHHVNDLLAQEPHVEDAPDAVPLPRLERDIVYENVSFRYGEDSFSLTDVDVRIAKGSFVALVGTSGSGKSTMLNLLLRLYDPTHGAIKFDGLDIKKATQESLRAQIGVVFQDNYLFNTTILENIRLGHPAARMEEIEAAARAAEIHAFISALPAGYNTVVGERGSQLSGGQRQRLAIARALVRDPAILMLDEATSALDYATEAALNATLLKVAQNRTVIMVTHRLSSVISAAHIVVLDKGRVVESGTHEELLRRRGAYAALWHNQVERRADSSFSVRAEAPSDPALQPER